MKPLGKDYYYGLMRKDFYTLLWTDEHTYPSDDNEDAAKLNLQVKNMNLSNRGSKGGYLDCMNWAQARCLWVYVTSTTAAENGHLLITVWIYDHLSSGSKNSYMLFNIAAKVIMILLINLSLPRAFH